MSYFSELLRKYIYQNDGYSPVYYSQLWDTVPRFNDIATDIDILNAALKNPALLKVIALQCDLFSIGNIKLYNSLGREVTKSPILDALAAPNPLQTQSQWLWSHMFNLCIGNSYVWIPSKIPGNGPIYILENTKMQFPQEMIKNQDKLVQSQSAINKLNQLKIKYIYQDSSFIEIPWGEISAISDLTNNTGNFGKSPSRITALRKLIANVESDLDSQNINLDFSGKFLVAGQNDPKNISTVPMATQEKESIEKQIMSGKPAHAVRSMIQINRFVEDVGKQKFSETYNELYRQIGLMYNVPREMLGFESTYENQGRATIAFMSTVMEPRAQDLMHYLELRWGLKESGYTLRMDWDNLPFNQLAQKDELATKQQQVSTFMSMVQAGISPEEANKFLDLNFTITPPKPEANATPS